MLLGYIRDKNLKTDEKFGYYYVTMLLLGLGVSGFFIGFFIKNTDSKSGTILEKYVAKSD